MKISTFFTVGSVVLIFGAVAVDISFSASGKEIQGTPYGEGNQDQGEPQRQVEEGQEDIGGPLRRLRMYVDRLDAEHERRRRISEVSLGRTLFLFEVDYSNGEMDPEIRTQHRLGWNVRPSAVDLARGRTVGRFRVQELEEEELESWQPGEPVVITASGMREQDAKLHALLEYLMGHGVTFEEGRGRRASRTHRVLVESAVAQEVWRAPAEEGSEFYEAGVEVTYVELAITPLVERESNSDSQSPQPRRR